MSGLRFIVPYLFTLCFFMLPMASETAAAGSGENKDLFADQRLHNAINAFYASDWLTAQELINELKTDHPGQPTVYFYDSMIPFWAYFFAGSQPEDARNFLQRSERAIDISERHLRTARNDTSTVLLLSGLHGYRSLVAASEREFRTAIRSAMTGFGYTRQLLALNSSDPNAQMGRGVFNYMMGTIPSEVRWLTSFAGLTGDREAGFAQLEEAANAGTHVSIDALMILTYLYLRDDEFENARRTSERLVALHPENVIFLYHHGRSLQLLGETEAAAGFFQKVVDLNHVSLGQLTAQARERLDELKES